MYLWQLKVFQIKEKYDELLSIRRVADELNYSVGLVCEAIALSNQWTKVEHCKSRHEALNLIRTINRPIEFSENLNTVFLVNNTNNHLRQYDKPTFDLSITQAKYLTPENIFQLYRVMRQDTFSLFFCDWSDARQSEDLIALHWALKKRPIVCISDSSQLILVAKKGRPRVIHDKDAFNYQDVSPTLKIHSDEKPVKLIEELIKGYCRKGNILDPFCYSAEVLKAAKNLGFNYVGLVRHERNYVRICRIMSREVQKTRQSNY